MVAMTSSLVARERGIQHPSAFSTLGTEVVHASHILEMSGGIASMVDSEA
jgi:hypothetical protein